MAADLPVASAPPVFVPVVPVSAFTWTGFYIGANLGYGGDRYKYPFSVSSATGDREGGAVTLVNGSASITSSGILGGAQAGFNYAFSPGNSVVVGAEADFDGASVSGRVGLDVGSPLLGGFGSVSAGSRMQYFGTVRGRLGYAFDRVMVYATGGFAYARVQTSIDASLGGGFFEASQSSTHTGYAVGGGVEYAITNNLTFKTEYVRAEFNTKSLLSGSLGGIGFNLGEKPSLNVVRAGLNYKFDFLSPATVVARY